MEKVRVRGLVAMCGWIFLACAAGAFVKGAYDLVAGQPEANLYSPQPWAFVTQAQWRRYAFFEAVYGLGCGCVSWLLFGYARWLPEYLRRERPRIGTP